MKTQTAHRLSAILLAGLLVVGCSKSVKSEDSAYGAQFRKMTEEQTKDVTDFNHKSWAATQEIRADGKVKPETLAALKNVLESKKAHYASFSSVKASEMFAEFHTITTDFMKQKLDLDTEQYGLFESAEERQLNRMTDKLEKIGLEYTKKLKACMEKVDKTYFDLAMKSQDEFR